MRAALLTGQPLELGAARFERQLARAATCRWWSISGRPGRPCRMMAPAFAQVAARMPMAARFVKVNTEAEPALAQRFNIRSIPTLAVFLVAASLRGRPGQWMPPRSPAGSGRCFRRADAGRPVSWRCRGVAAPSYRPRGAARNSECTPVTPLIRVMRLSSRS